MTELDYAWAAGLVDGEGCICIRKQKPNLKKGEKNIKYNIVLTVSMTNMPTIERLNEIFPGIIQSKPRQKEKDKWQIRWWAKKSNIIEIINVLYHI